jgi:orotidine-5'-phosphate decarboxylase
VNKLIAALDVETAAEARQIIEELKGAVGAFKIGLQLFTSAGASFVRETVESGARVFLDLKFHDIPNTVARASIEAARMGVWMFNLHASGGGEMMRRAATETREFCRRENLTPPLIIGVTVLTSSNDETLREVGIEATAKSQAANLARLAADSNLDGVVTSPLEIEQIRGNVASPDFLIVTPGIRSESMPESEKAIATFDDQKRVKTAREAVAAGADFIVVGRPILRAKDRRAAALKILEEIGF